jgi:hypothetical protein
MRNTIRTLLVGLAAIIIPVFAVASVYGQRTRSGASALTSEPQPLFSEYKGIRLGITAKEVRDKLGDPTIKGDDQDFYAFSETETAQFAYDKLLKVVTISIDYTGAGAPDYRNVVGQSIEERPDGGLYKLVRYEARHLWVSYSRTAGTQPIVTITIQKM